MLLRKLIFLAVIISAGFWVGYPSYLAQGVQAHRRYGKPTQLKSDRLIRTKFKEFCGKHAEECLLIERFYPIGWSKDGKFAYLAEPADEACSCYLAKLVIQNLRTDKILWEYNHQGEPDETLEDLWKARQELFSEKLEEYEIEAVKGFALSESKIHLGGDLLIPKLQISRDKASDNFGDINKVVLQVYSKQKGKKTVYEKYYGSEKYSGLLDAKIFGYLSSPYEPRVGFIMVEVRRGWEGPPNSTRTHVIGSSLVTGFR